MLTASVIVDKIGELVLEADRKLVGHLTENFTLTL